MHDDYYIRDDTAKILTAKGDFALGSVEA